MSRFTPYPAKWNGTPVYVLGLCRRRDEGEVGHDLRVRPVRLGKGTYTMVVAPDDVTPDAHHSTMAKGPRWYRWAVNYRDSAGRVKQTIVESTGHREAIVAGQHAHPEGSDFSAVKQSATSHHSTIAAGAETLKVKDRYSGGTVWLTMRDGKVVGAMGADPHRYVGLTLAQAQHHARHGGTPLHMTVKSPAQLQREIAEALAGRSSGRAHSQIKTGLPEHSLEWERREERYQRELQRQARVQRKLEKARAKKKRGS